MVSAKLLELENHLQNLSLEEKLWLLGKIVQQMREIPQLENARDELADIRYDTKVKPIENARDELADIRYDTKVKPIWEIAVEIGANIPESEWEQVPSDLSKNFDLYQGSGE